MTWLEDEFLNAPVEDFTDVEFVFRRTGHFVNPAELAELLAGLAEHAQDFSVETELIDAAGKSVGTIEHLVGSRRDANGPGRARSHGAGRRGGLVADGGASVGRGGNIDGDLAEELSIGVEDLDAPVAAVGDVDVVARVDGDAVRQVELAGLIAGFAPGFKPVAVLIDFCNSRIDIAVRDEIGRAHV